MPDITKRLNSTTSAGNSLEKIIKKYVKDGYQDLTFCEALNYYMQEKECDMREFSKHVGISLLTCLSWVNSVSAPRQEKVFVVEHFLGLPYGYLIALLIRDFLNDKYPAPGRRSSNKR